MAIRRPTQLAQMAALELMPLINTTAMLPTANLKAPANPSNLNVISPRTPKLPLIAQLQQYLGIRDVGDMSTLPTSHRFPVASPDETTADVALPFGVPRHVRAGMLKLLAGGRRSDTMLELKGDAWDFVTDDSVVDLKDRSRVFRVGRALILS